MNQHQLRSLLEQVADGSVTTDDAMLQLKSAPFQVSALSISLSAALTDFLLRLKAGRNSDSQ